MRTSVNVAIARYEAQIIFGVTAALPVLGLPLAAFVEGLMWQRPYSPTPQLIDVLRIFEVALPLMTGLAAAHLMTVEREEGFDELRRSYPEATWRVPLLRTAGACLLALISLALGLVGFRLAYGPFDVGVIVGPAIPPALVLLGLALTAGNLTASYWLAAAAVMGTWFFEFQTKGVVTKTFFLFEASWPVPGVDYDLNRGLLVLVGVALIATNGYISVLRRRGLDPQRWLAWLPTKPSTGE
jgi:hypothetical protein